MKTHDAYVSQDNTYARGSNYAPLLSNGKEYLCPDCGGYKSYGNYEKCPFCEGKGTLSLKDERIFFKECKHILYYDHAEMEVRCAKCGEEIS